MRFLLPQRGRSGNPSNVANPISYLCRSQRSRHLHRGQSRREGPRHSAGASVSASAPSKQGGATPATLALGWGGRGPRPGASESGTRGAAALGPVYNPGPRVKGKLGTAPRRRGHACPSAVALGRSCWLRQFALLGCVDEGAGTRKTKLRCTSPAAMTPTIYSTITYGHDVESGLPRSCGRRAAQSRHRPLTSGHGPQRARPHVRYRTTSG